MVGFDAETLIPAFLAAPSLQLLEKLLLGAFGSGGGQLGVMLFFTLSAFLMFHLYFDCAPTASALRNFAAARVARIFPLFYFVFAVAAVSTPWLPFTFIDIQPDEILKHVFFFQGNSVLWTIAPELVFYLFFMAAWRAFHTRPQMMFTIALLVIIFSNLTPVLWKSYTIDFFMLGFIIYYYRKYRFGTYINKIPQFFHLSLFAMVIGLLQPAVHNELLFPVSLDGWNSYHYLFLIGFLFILTFESKSLMFIFSSRLMRFFGNISFSVYLTHLLVLNGLTHYGLVGPNIASLAMALGLITLLGAVLFYGLEKPSRRALRRRLSAR